MPITITESAIPAWIDMNAIAESELRERIKLITVELRGDFVNLTARLKAASALLEEAHKCQPGDLHLAGPQSRAVTINDATGTVWRYFTGITDLHMVMLDIADVAGRAADSEEIEEVQQ